MLKWNIILVLLVMKTLAQGQTVTLADSLYEPVKVSFFQPSPELNKKRFYGMAGLGVTMYGGFSYGLYNSWYKDFPKGDFRFFDDGKEWLQMDKAGHLFSAYFQTAYSYQVARWTGLKKTPSLYTAAAISTLVQTTIETMDGFSSKWGFSLKDVAANVGGTSLFVIQESLWDHQYIVIKESSLPVNYSEAPIFSLNNSTKTSLEERADDLFGTTALERALKDYNVQTYWASVDVHEILGKPAIWPKWLNLAFGYGASGLFGGFNNQWTNDATGVSYDVSNQIKRQRQYYLGLDVNFHKVRTKSHLINGLLDGLNIFKTPSPAIEYSGGEWRFHLLFW